MSIERDKGDGDSKGACPACHGSGERHPLVEGGRCLKCDGTGKAK